MPSKPIPQMPGSTSGDTFVEYSASQAGHTFIERARAQSGDVYVFGAVARADDPDPDAFDCAELVQWAAAQAGVTDVPTGSWLQYQYVHQAGTTMSVEEALDTPGALLFRFGGGDPLSANRPSDAHVAISLGNGKTIEARSRKYGVGEFDADGRKWTHAGRIADLDLPANGSPVVVEPPRVIDVRGDSDADGIADRYEALVGTDPFNADSDGDGFGDLEETVDFATDATDFADNIRNEQAGVVPDPPPEPDPPSPAPQPSTDPAVDLDQPADLTQEEPLLSPEPEELDASLEDDVMEDSGL